MEDHFVVSFIVEGAVLRHRVPSVVIAFERDDLFRLTRRRGDIIVFWGDQLVYRLIFVPISTSSIVFAVMSLFSLELITIEFLLIFEDFQENVILFDFASGKIMRLIL